MQCFEVSINGKRVCCAGTPRGQDLTVKIARGGAAHAPFVAIAGDLYADNGRYEHQSWGMHRLSVGDELAVRVTESEMPDEPHERHRIAPQDAPYSSNPRHQSAVAGKSLDEPPPAGPPKVVGIPYCSFCGKSRREVRAMVAGPTSTVYICNECVQSCLSKMSGQTEPPTMEKV